jgi:puromycin-sensitive aminopeptidase
VSRTGGGESTYRLPRTVIPSRYELAIEPDLAAGTFRGAEDVRITVREPVREIVLNAVDLRVEDGRLTNGNGTKVDVSEISLDRTNERARVLLAEPAQPGEWTLHLEYTGVLNERLVGFYPSTYIDAEGRTRTIATTHFEAADARRAFPCWDEPDLKAVFSVTLVVEDGLVALSNTPEVGREPSGDRKVAVRFDDTIPMSTYLVAWVVGPLELTEAVDVDGVPLRVAYVPGKGHLVDFAIESGAFSLRFFTDYYGIPYPEKKVDFVALPDFAAGAMENLGLITYRESLLLVEPSQSTQQELLAVADVVAHELAHMWFGDLVTMRWWNGIWLNEAFATFMANLAVDAFRPDWDRWGSFRRVCSTALEIDGLDSTRPIEYPVNSPDDASDMFDSLTYTKGAAVLRMLERYLGPGRFRDGIRRYLRDHEFGNTETSDLWDSIETATEEPVRRIMDTWIWQGGYPLVTVREDGDSLSFAQERFRYDGGDDGTRWEVPLLAREPSGRDGEVRAILVEPMGADLPRLARDPVVVANAEGASFLRVGYEGALRERVWTHALEALAAIERFGLVDDTWAEAVAGGVPAAEYLELVRGLTGETDLHVWQTVVTTIGWFDRFVEAEAREGLRRYVRELARPAFDRLGWEPGPDEPDLSRSLRGTLVSGLAILGGDAEVSARARELEAEARAGEPLDASLAAAAVAVVAATGDGHDVEGFLARSKDAPTPQEQLRYLYALADFRQPNLIDRTLDLALSDEVRSQNAPFLLARAMANRDVGDRAWRFVEDHWEEVNRRLPPNTIIYLADGVRFLTTPDQEADAQAFFDQHDIPQARKMLKQVLERQRINVAFRRRVEPQLAAFFG